MNCMIPGQMAGFPQRGPTLALERSGDCAEQEGERRDKGLRGLLRAA